LQVEPQDKEHIEASSWSDLPRQNYLQSFWHFYSTAKFIVTPFDKVSHPHEETQESPRALLIQSFLQLLLQDWEDSETQRARNPKLNKTNLFIILINRLLIYNKHLNQTNYCH
jgi:hypothetical protein